MRKLFGRDHGGMLWELPDGRCGGAPRRNGIDRHRGHDGGRHAPRKAASRPAWSGIRVYRPFPKEEVREAFRNAKAIIIFEKSISYGYEGGLCSDLKAAFYGTASRRPSMITSPVSAAGTSRPGSSWRRQNDSLASSTGEWWNQKQLGSVHVQE